MRRLSVLVVCILLVSAAGSATTNDNLLTNYWNQQRTTAQPQAMQVGATAGAPHAKTLVGLEFGTTTHDLLAKAQPDECYESIGGPTGKPPCGVTSQPKVNQAYAWGMVDVGTDVWFGTVANTHCLVLSTMIGAALGGPVGPIETDSWVCEFGGAVYNPVGDQRRPHIYVWHSTTNTLEDKFADMDGTGQTLLNTVVGIRAAGFDNDVVLLAGLTITGQVAMFAFEADGNYIDSALLPWSDVRKFAVLNDELYVGVAVPGEGQVLHWTGNSVTPFTFDVVTSFPGEQAAELISHEGRLVAGTWPIPPALAGVWISPDPGGGILAPGAWTKIWQVDVYERDPISAAVTGVGAMASYGGNLYWGTMHPPFLAVAAHMGVYGAFYSDIDDAGYLPEFLLTAFLGNHRATTFWVDRDAATPGLGSIDLLYGLPVVPVFTPGPVPLPTSITPLVEDYWDIVDTGWTPEWGISGFGNLLNSYTWSTTVNNGRLWVGTMDMTYLLQDLGMTILGEFLESEGISLAEFFAALETELGIPDFAASILSVLTGNEEFVATAGADLYYFPFPDAPAFPESWGGIDNYTSYGVRNMVSMGGSVYAGMANPMNLLTDPTDNVPEGGWELIKLDDVPPNTPTGTEVTVVLDDGTRVTLCEVEDPGYTVGIWLPLANLPSAIPPPGRFAPAENLMLVGTSSNASMCAGSTMATVCVPRTSRNVALFQLQMIDDPGGAYPGWVDITTDVNHTMICGEVNAAYQDLMWQLGYAGYIGIVAPFAFLPNIPDTGFYGRMMLILLIAAAALIVIRMRMR